MRIGAMRSFAIGLTFATVFAACASDDGATNTAQGSAASESPSTAESPSAQAATVAVADSDLGSILVDADGRTLYLLETDKNGSSTCYGDCAGTWPALESDAPTGGTGIDDSLLGTTERNDGSMQVTYAGHPLYLFSGDSAPGDTNGQEIGDVWYVVDAKGTAVEGGGGRPGY